LLLQLLIVIHVWQAAPARVLGHTANNTIWSLLIEMVIKGVAAIKLIVMGSVELLVFQAILLHVVIGGGFLER
jgi:hypothetical protein